MLEKSSLIKDELEISIVIPVYGCNSCLFDLHERLVKVLEKITHDYEIIFVNDACPQNSWEAIVEIAQSDHKVIGIDLSRNFGQIRAITAGLSFVRSRWAVVMDCDLQDQPENIVPLYNKAQEGYDVVISKYKTYYNGYVRRFFSRFFYKIYGYFTDKKYDPSLSNFSICRRIVVDNYLKMGDRNRAYILFIKWMGFRTTTIDIERANRKLGKSSYNFSKQLNLALEVITTQSNKPLLLSIKVGLLIALLSLIGGGVIILRYMISGVSVAGWSSMIVSLWFLGGVVLINLGVLGMYIGYVFNHVKNRPIFIVRETIQSGISSYKNNAEKL